MKFSVNGKEVSINTEEALAFLIEALPNQFKRDLKYSESEIREGLTKVNKKDIKAFVTSKLGCGKIESIVWQVKPQNSETEGNKNIEKHRVKYTDPVTGQSKLIDPIPTVWDKDSRGKLTNISGANFLALKQEFERRGIPFNLSVEEARKRLRELENEKFGEDSHYERVESGYLTPRTGERVQLASTSKQSSSEYGSVSQTYTPGQTSLSDDWQDLTRDQDWLVNLNLSVSIDETFGIPDFIQDNLEEDILGNHGQLVEEMAENLAVALQGALNPEVTKPKSFTGDKGEDVRRFLEDYEEYMESRKKGDDVNKKASFIHCLDGTAKNFIKNEAETFQGLDFEGYKQKFIEEFARGNGDMEIFLSRVQGANETPFKYVEEKRQLAGRANLNSNSKDIIQIVIKGLNKEIYDKLYMANNNTYSELKGNIQKAMHRIQEEKLSSFGASGSVNLLRSFGNSDSSRKIEERVEKLEKNLEKVEQGVNSLNISVKSWEQNFNDWGRRFGAIESFIYTGMGQPRQNQQFSRYNNRNFEQDPRPYNPYPRRCYECNDPSHLRNQCPRLYGPQNVQQPKNENLPGQARS